jgi:hypothetical protein
LARQGALAARRRCDRIPCAAKGNKERIPLIVDLLATSCLKRVAEQQLMLGQYIAVPFAELLQQLRRALDVREQ